MRRAFVALIPLLLAGCFGGGDGGDGEPGDAGPGAERPPAGEPSWAVAAWSTGHRWDYTVTVTSADLPQPVSSSYELRVIDENARWGQEAAYKVHSTKTDEDTLFTKDDLNPVARDQEVRYHDFPLWVGRNWTTTDPATGGEARVKVERAERIGSSAGTFDALRIRLDHENGDWERYWFAPQVENFAVWEVHLVSSGTPIVTRIVLDGYEV